MGLEYRFRTTADDDQLLQLWCECSGWDQLDMSTWRHRFLETPLGEAKIVVVEDNNRIIGQHVFFPGLVRVGNRIVNAVRPFAPIVRPEYRGSIAVLVTKPLSHPVVASFNYGANELGKGDADVLFMTPDPMWARLMKVMPSMQLNWFPLYSLPLPPGTQPVMPDGFTTRLLTNWDDERIDQLEEKSATHYECSLLRNRKGLPWKLSHQQYEVQLIERDDDLVGLVASLQKGDRQWLICDTLVADMQDSLTATLTAVVNLAHDKSVVADDESPITKTSILATEPMKPVLKQLGFTKEKYRFPFVVKALNDRVSKDEIAPHKWYGAAND